MTAHLFLLSMGNTNQSEARLQIDLIDTEIKVLDETIELLNSKLITYEAKLNVLKERKKSMLNYLNNDND